MPSDSQAAAFILQPGAGHAIEGPVGGPVVFKVRGPETDGRLMLMENRVAPGEGPPLHLHPHEDEYFYVLDGVFRFRTNDDVTEAPAGSFVFVPHTVPHCFQNIGPAAGRLLVWFTPAGMERFYENLAAMPAHDRSPSAFAQAGAEVGMLVVGPTLAVSHPERQAVERP